MCTLLSPALTFKWKSRSTLCIFGHRKGKKEGKQDSKDKETDIEKAKANAALWELRLQATDQSLVQYREACRKLARANEELTNQLYRQEKDAIDVTGYLKRQDAAKEEKVCVRLYVGMNTMSEETVFNCHLL